MSSNAAPEQPHSAQAETAASETPVFPVVGLGASAGGLAALQRFFAAMPADSGMAFVVIMHLPPEHESHAASILQHATSMPVLQITEPVHVEQNMVYVIPPTKHLAMSDGMIGLSEIDRSSGRHVAIDLFFRTLSETHTTHAACIVLSGTGSDGSVGIRHVKEAGGITLVQDPQEAEYDAMPRNAINTGAIDFVLPVAQMPAQLMAVWQNSEHIALPIGGETPRVDESRAAEEALQAVLQWVRTRTGHDFASYKRATILRRLERRMQVTTTQNLPAYRAYLRSHPSEVNLLVQDLLISVTNFFRDREAFAALEQTVIPRLFEGKTSGDIVRVWVAACASGEEAYSVAILLLEHAARIADPPNIQVFATDIDQNALRIAREGSYPEAIAADVSPQRLQNFFTKDMGGYLVTPALRERVLFAEHNILRDPPFSHLDLVSCRNLLIYLQREMQERVFELFHFALRSAGYLFLGSADSVDGATKLFRTIDKKHGMFHANGVGRVIRHVPTLPLNVSAAPLLAKPEATTERQRIAFGELHQRMLEQYAPPSLVVNETYEIVHLSNRAGQFLRLPSGEPSLNLLKVVLPDLRLELRTALFQAFQSGKSTEAGRVQIVREGRTVYVTMVVRPRQNPETNTRFALVLFDEVEAILGAEAVGAATGVAPSIVRQLEDEVQQLKDHLQATVEQNDVAVEELWASNEELQATIEELRSTSEELETSKEELQSINEELRTVNNELKYNVDELSESNDDLRNLMSSTDIATVFLDRNLDLKRYTPRTLDLFNLIPTDEGRQFAHITHNLDYAAMLEDAAQVLRTLQPVAREVGSRNGPFYLARIAPYRTIRDHIAGVVLTFVDITARKRAEEAMHASQERLRLLIESAKDFGIFTMTTDGVIDTWNSGAERIFGYHEQEILGQPVEILFTPEDRAQHVPAREMQQAQSEGRASDERWHLRKDDQRFFASGVVTPLRDTVLHGYVKIFRDLTAQKQAEAALAHAYDAEQAARVEAEAALRTRDQFLSIASHELRTPMTALVGYTQMLQKASEQGRGDTQKMTTRIVRQVHRLNSLISQLLDVSRLQRGQFDIEHQNVDLAALSEQVANEFRATLPTEGTHTIEFTRPNDAVMIVGDAARLEQVLFNLLSNAIKYSPQGGQVHVNITQHATEAVIEITDQGIGIPTDAQARLFEPFYRASHVGVGASGFGLGLYIASEIVQRHGGHIEVRSAENAGSTFRVALPRG